jgi:hypothetical protein
MKTIHKVLIAIAIVVVSIAIAFGIYVTKKAEQVVSEYRRQLAIDLCIQDVYESYHTGWDSYCKLAGELPNCILYRKDAVDMLEQQLSDGQKMCVQRYAK